MGSINTARQSIILKVHLCDLRSGVDDWSATIAVEGPSSASGVTVAIFYEGRKFCVGELDEWGYWLVELENLPPPFNLTSETYFEVRTKTPPKSFASPKFHPPLVASALQEFIERLRTWPKELPLRGVQLEGAALGQANLKGIDFTGANLTGAKLWGANLTGAILRDALLDQADFSSAILARSDLQGASVHDTDWHEANLKGADLRMAQGLPLEMLEKWIDLATLDETQIARVKLSDLTKQKEQASQDSRYRSTQSDSQSPNSYSQSPNSYSQSPNSYAQSPNSYAQSYKPSDSISHSRGNSFYRSPKDFGRSQDRSNEGQEEEPWSPKLPPAVILSDDEVETNYQTERQFYKAKLEKYQQQRTLRGGVEFTLNMIPNGSFEMGSDVDEDNERPRHKVKMCFPLLVGETLVTQALYERVMTQANFKFRGKQYPAESVTWAEAIDFCNRLSQLEGLKSAYELGSKGIKWIRESNGYRLPTEAEWEYFSRAGVASVYAGSNNLDLVGWYQNNSNECTQAVRQKRENAWGLYDISGNVWEWCYDTYMETSYHSRSLEPNEDPIVEGEGPKVIRGGSWSYEEHGLRTAYRSRLSAKFKTSRVGFRIVRSPKLKMKGD